MLESLLEDTGYAGMSRMCYSLGINALSSNSYYRHCCVIYFMMDLGLTNTLKNCCKNPTIGRGELFKPHHSSWYHGTGRARDIGSQQIVDPNDGCTMDHVFTITGLVIVQNHTLLLLSCNAITSP